MNENPILYTQEYCVKFDDGKVRKLTEKMIADSMYSTCDDYRNEYLMMDLIVDYRKNDKSITLPDQKVVQGGQIFMWQSTVGWNLCVQWRDDSASWKELKDLKESSPVETSKYTMAQ